MELIFFIRNFNCKMQVSQLLNSPFIPMFPNAYFHENGSNRINLLMRAS